MRGIKRIAVAVLLLMSVVLFVGCDGEVNVFRYADDQFNYEDVQIVLSVDVASQLEAASYSFIDYLTDCAEFINTTLSLDDGNGYSYYKRFTNDSRTLVSYYIIGKFPKTEGMPNRDFSDPVAESENLFIGVMSMGCNNALGGVYEQFVQRGAGNKAIEAINGFGGFPSIFDTYPTLLGGDYSELKITQYVESYRKSYNEDGKSAEYFDVYGMGEGVGGYFVPFETTFGEASDDELIFKTKYYVSVGWYIVAIGVGVLAVVLLILMRKRKTAKNTAPAAPDVNEASDDGLIESQKVELPKIPLFAAPPFPSNRGMYPPQGTYPPQGMYPPQGTYPPQGMYPPQGTYPPNQAFQNPQYPFMGQSSMDPFEEFSTANKQATDTPPVKDEDNSIDNK